MESRRARLPLTVLALGATSLFNDIASEMVFPLLPGFLAVLGAGPAFLGLLEGVADAVSAFLKYLAGQRADVRGRKGLVLFGYGLTTVVRPLLALVAAPWQVLAIRATDRMGKGLRTAPRDALLASAVPASDTGRAFGFHRAMDHTGAVVGPLLATALLFFGVSVRTVFALTLVPGLLVVASLLLVKEPPLPASSAPTASAASAPMPARLKHLLGLFFFFALANSSDAFLLLRAREVGTEEKWLPVLWLLLHLSKVFWTMRAGAWSDRMPRHRLVLAGWAVYAGCYALLALSVAAWQVWLVVVAYGAFAGLTEPVEKAMVKDLAPETARGRAFGLYHGLLGAAAIPAGLLTGALWQAFGAAAALFTGAAVAAVSSVGLLLWARRDGAQSGGPARADG
ncbi:MAG: MFS transporter [Myxococcota bacterium]